MSSPRRQNCYWDCTFPALAFSENLSALDWTRKHRHLILYQTMESLQSVHFLQYTLLKDDNLMPAYWIGCPLVHVANNCKFRNCCFLCWSILCMSSLLLTLYYIIFIMVHIPHCIMVYVYWCTWFDSIHTFLREGVNLQTFNTSWYQKLCHPTNHPANIPQNGGLGICFKRWGGFSANFGKLHF